MKRPNPIAYIMGIIIMLFMISLMLLQHGCTGSSPFIGV